jgi:predicted MFS family arabinose efflux permease
VSPPLSRRRQVIAVPGVPALLAGAVVGRFAYGVMPVAVFLSLLHASGSVRQAAALSAVYGLVGAVLFPRKGRLVDRHGRVALWGLALPSLSAAAGSFAVQGVWSLFGLLLVIAVSSPPVTSTVRAAWGARIPEHLRETAFSLDAGLEEVAFLAGPAAGGLLVATAGSRPTLLVVGLLLLAAVALLAALQVAADDAPSSRAGGLSRGAHLVSGLLTTAALAQGLVGATIAVAAKDLRSSGLYGLLLSLDGLGSLLGLALFGAVALSGPRKLVLLAVLTPVLTVPLLLAHGTFPLLLAVTVLGVPVAAFVALLNARITNLEEPGRWNEAFSFLVTCQNLAGAVGFALGGVLADPLGRSGPAAVGAVVMCAGFGALLLPLLRLSTSAGSR